MRFPLAPLEEWLRVTNDGMLAEHLGCARRSIHRYRTLGLLPRTAERMAHRIGAHPVELWPDLYPTIIPLEDLAE